MGSTERKRGRRFVMCLMKLLPLLFNTPVPEDGDSRGLFGGINQDQENFSVSISIS